MRVYRSLVAIAGLCGMALIADGQTDDWLALQNFDPGTRISVVKRARLSCGFVNVTDSELICDRTIVNETRRYVFKREQVREIRLEVPEANHWILGAVVGGTIGGIFGILGGSQLADPEARAYAGFYGIPIGAFIGARIGHAIHRHGAVLYRRP